MVSVIGVNGQYYWRGEWAEKYRDDGIVAAALAADFYCNVCDANYALGNKGESSISQHIATQGHRKKKAAIPPPTGITVDQLRPAFVFLVKEKGMSREGVASLFGVDRHTVGDAVARFDETGDNKNRGGQGRRRTTTDDEHVEEARHHLEENPRTTRRRGITGNSVRKVARKVGISRTSAHRIYRDRLGLRAYKDVERKKLTPDQRIKRLVWGRRLRRRFAGGLHRQIIFTDESPFVIEQHHNAQNDRTWAGSAPPKEMRTVERDQKPAGVMVWGAIGYNFKGPLVFISENTKVNSAVYQRILSQFERIIKHPDNPYKRVDENGRWLSWTFQQDGAPSHRSIVTQRWISQHFPDMITKDEWPPSSPDINPIELIWGILKTRVNPEAHPSVASLKEALKREWRALTIEEINTTIEGWMPRLEKMLAVHGGRFE